MKEDRLVNHTSDVTAEACAWIAQLETGDMTRADIDAFREWMHRSPCHAAEIRQLGELSAELNVLTEYSNSLQEAIDHYNSITSRRTRNAYFTPLRMGSWIAAMSFVLATVLFVSGESSPPKQPLQLHTAVGDYLQQELPDGTTVKLNTNSRIEIQYVAAERRVHLLQGEASFEVAHNPDRPFVVEAAGKMVQAVGTAFVVRLTKRDFEVTVTEGRVQFEQILTRSEIIGPVTIAKDGSHNGEKVVEARTSIMLEAGQRLFIPAQSVAEAVQVISEDELRRKLSWQEGLLDFTDTPLGEVVSEVNRYNIIQVVITDPALSELKFGGIFRTKDTELLMEALESAFEIKSEYVDDTTIHLKSTKRNSDVSKESVSI